MCLASVYEDDMVLVDDIEQASKFDQIVMDDQKFCMALKSQM